jgi:hypothetical protein
LVRIVDGFAALMKVRGVCPAEVEVVDEGKEEEWTRHASAARASGDRQTATGLMLKKKHAGASSEAAPTSSSYEFIVQNFSSHTRLEA